MSNDTESEWHQGADYFKQLAEIDRNFCDACYQVAIAKNYRDDDGVPLPPIKAAFEGYEKQYGLVNIFYDMVFEWMGTKVDVPNFVECSQHCDIAIGEIRRLYNESKRSGSFIVPSEVANKFREFMRALRKFAKQKGMRTKLKPGGF